MTVTDLKRSVRVRIGEGGRIVLPAEYRKALSVRKGDELLILWEDGVLKVMPMQEAVRQIREIVRQYVPEGVSLSDELLADRRAEAARE